MARGETQSIAPAVEPVTLAEAKAHLRVDSTADDTYITTLISVAREAAEHRQRRQLITATWVLTLDAFPAWAISLPYPPLQAVTNVVIKYYDTGGVERTLDAAEYTAQTTTFVGTLFPAYGKTWPSTYDIDEAVEITYKAGYGDAATDVPHVTRQGILMLISHWYENRESVVLGTIATEIPNTARALLDMNRVREIA